MDHSAVEKEFLELSLQAGSVILDAFNAPEIKTSWKSDGSPVTAADLAADELIRNGLARAFPGILIVSEENSASHRQSADRFFLVDPLDGTSGFRRRRKNFTVNIALIENGSPVRGVVYGPALGRHFCTDAAGMVVERKINPGTGAILGSARFAPQRRANRGLRVLASSSHGVDGRVGALLAAHDVAGVEILSSSIKFCLIAVREADLYPRVGTTMEWDTAAGHAILGAAGGEVYEFGSDRILTYGKPHFINPDFVACAPGVMV